jgi:hypothetical protein
MEDKAVPLAALELGRLGGIPPSRQAWFADRVEEIVATYRPSRESKSPHEVKAELKHLEQRVWRCLRLRDHKTWRPREFRRRLEDLSSALAGVSSSAHDYLQLRNVELALEIPEGFWSAIVSNVVVDPICFQCLDEQFNALEQLWGALSGPVARPKGRGRPAVGAERALHLMIAPAYVHAKGGKGLYGSKFMAVCDEIKRMYKLSDWRPESIARSSRSRGCTHD